MMVFLVMFGIATSVLIVVILSHNVFAQSGETLHDRRLSEVVNQTSSSQQSSQIDAGGGTIQAIGVSELRNTVYVVKTDPDIVSVISGENNTWIKDIEVGDAPGDIAVSEDTETAYVTNRASNSISVIDLENNTKIGADISDGIIFPFDISESGGVVFVANGIFNYIYGIIAETNQPIINENTGQPLTTPVGDGTVAIDYSAGTIYVADIDNSISVFHWRTQEPIINENTGQPITIPVGRNPRDIAVNEDTSMVYVANSGSDTVSVINEVPGVPALINYTTGQPLTIPVGDAPGDIAVNELTNTVYVANSGSNGVSVIDAETNEVVTGVTFNVEPFNSGYIACDDPTVNNTNDTNGLTTPPLGQYIYVPSGTQCIAKPYEGFEFLSWEQNLEDNSTQLLSVSAPASPLDSFVLAVTDFFGDKPDKPEAKLMTEFGTFTANFKEAPAPLPPEFWAQMYAVIATVITALFIPSIVGWFKSKRDEKKLNYFHKKIDALYQDGKLDENDIGELDQLREDIVDTYSEGKINDKHYESLKNEMSILYEKIFRNRIKGSPKNNPSNKKATEGQLAQIKTELEYAHSEGKISEIQYVNLKDEISILYDKTFRKRIDDSLNDGSQKETMVKQFKEIRDELEYTYSEGKISQKHYDLLDKAILKLDSKEGNNKTRPKNM